jgi:hypothetical protein
MALMDTPRYLCSQLVRLLISDSSGHREQWANLEEIWSSGAVLECEEEVASGSSAKISCDEVTFAGRVAAVERHVFGWTVEMAFSPLTPWTIERWRPEHALDPNALW